MLSAIDQEVGLVEKLIKFGSINSQDVIHFLEKIKSKFKNSNIAVLMDNHPMHKTEGVKRTLKQLEILPVYNIPYAPYFNTIELFWNLVKCDFKRKILSKIIAGE